MKSTALGKQAWSSYVVMKKRKRVSGWVRNGEEMDEKRRRGRDEVGGWVELFFYLADVKGVQAKDFLSQDVYHPFWEAAVGAGEGDAEVVREPVHFPQCLLGVG